jgi:hypothetical protein
MNNVCIVLIRHDVNNVDKTQCNKGSYVCTSILYCATWRGSSDTDTSAADIKCQH